MAYKYTIGDWVVFSHESRLIYNDNGDRLVASKPRPGVGIICGAVRKFLGKKGERVGENDEPLNEYFPIALAKDGMVEMYLVRQGMINRSVMVLENHLRKIPKQKIDFPWMFNSNNEDSKRLVRMVRFKYTV